MESAIQATENKLAQREQIRKDKVHVHVYTLHMGLKYVHCLA